MADYEKGGIPANAVTKIRFYRKTWVDVVVKDTEGNVLEGFDYQLELPDGELKEGTLGSDGKIREEEVLPGTCQLRIPWDIEQETKKSTFEADLGFEDDPERTLKGWRYSLSDPEGTLLAEKRQVPDDGLIHHDDVPIGMCQLSLHPPFKWKLTVIVDGVGDAEVSKENTLRLRLEDEDGVTLSGASYTLSIGALTFEGTVGDDGYIVQEVPAEAKDGSLTFEFDGEEYEMPIHVADHIAR